MASVKTQVMIWPWLEQVSAVIRCCGGLTPPETTDTEFFKYMKKKKSEQIHQWSEDSDTIIKVMSKQECKWHVWFKKEKTATVFQSSFSEEEPSQFKTGSPITVQSDAMPFLCAKGLKKACPGFFEVHLLLPKANFSFKRPKGTGKRVAVSMGGFYNERQDALRVPALQSIA